MKLAPLSQERPSNIRYFVLFLTTLVAVLLYLDRICLGFAARYIKDDLDFTDGQMRMVMESFFWAYAIGQLPAGWLCDRFGARLMLTIFLAGWSALTGLLGLAYTLIWLVALRFGCGLFEAGAYPAAAGLIRRWMPFHRRGISSGIVSVGGRIGGALAPLMTAYLMVAFIPISKSSRIETADFHQPAAFVGRLTAPNNDSARRLADEIFLRLEPETAAHLRHVQLADHAFRTVMQVPSVATAPLRGAAAGGIADRELFRALDSVLAETAVAYDLNPLDFDLPKSELPISATGLSREQVERDNRLLLEAAYPESIRKIHRTAWRPVMLIYGGAGIVVALLFWFFMRDSPRQHPGCNAAEVALIEQGDVPVAPSAEGRLPMRWLLLSPSLWWISLVQFLTNFAWIFLITWFPKLLHDVYKVPIVERGWLTSLPIFVGIVGMFAGGWLTDAMVRRLGRRWGRSLPLALSRFVVAAGFLLCLLLNTPWPVTIALCLVAFATDLGTPSIWAYCLDTGGKHIATVLAWGNMFGNIGAALGSRYLDVIVEGFGWNIMFLTCALFMVFAGVVALFIDATKPIVPEIR